MNWHATGIDWAALSIVSIFDFLEKNIHKKTVANLIPAIVTPVAVSFSKRLWGLLSMDDGKWAK